MLRGRRQAAMLFGMSGSRGAPGRCAARLGLVKASNLVSSHPERGKANVLVVFWHQKGDILFGLGDSGQW